MASILAGATLTGEQDGDDAGAALDVGDLDGDGYADLVTAGPGADLAWVVYGPLSSTSLDAAELRLVGDGASLGADVTLLGDVDDDGLDEAAVTGPDATSGAGTVCLLDADDLGDLAQADAWCLDGDGADELFSAAPADGGLLVGVPGRKSSAGATEGGARLLPGPLDATSDLADAWLLAGLGNTATGEAVTAADVDGDGYDDLLIGAPDDDSGATNAGSVFLVLGPLSADLDLGDADLRIDGPNRSAFLGQEGALAAPGDLDDDGYDDLLAGLRGADAQDGSTTDNGRVLVLLGTPSPAWTLEADAVIEGDEDEELGGRVAGAGDVDADGQLDVVVGGPESDVDDTNAGRAWLVYGSTWSGTLAADDLVITNTTSGDAFGTVAAGDVTGDGTDDLVVGASGYDSDRGAIYLFVGGGI